MNKLAIVVLASCCLCLLNSPAKCQSVIKCEADTCDTSYSNGELIKTVRSDAALVALSARDTGKYLAVRVTVQNLGSERINVLPEELSAKDITPKKGDKTLKYMAPTEIKKKARRKAGWANGLNAFGAGMARTHSTTQTTSSGNVNVYGSDGSSASGTYNGSASSTTSAPDYEAQARARANIAARRANLAAAEAHLDAVVLRDQTLQPNDAVSGLVYFQRPSKKDSLVIRVPVGPTVFEFPFYPAKK